MLLRNLVFGKKLYIGGFLRHIATVLVDSTSKQRNALKSRGADKRFHRLVSLVSYGAAISLLTTPAVGLSQTRDARPLCCVGNHYPALQSDLFSQVETFIKLSPPRTELSKLQAIIVPNAPFVYVGPILGSAYSNLANRSYDRIVILGHDPSATAPALYIGTKFSTPLGQLSSDDTFAKQIIERCKVQFEIVGAEYPLPASIEPQLPFIKYLYGEKPIVAIGLGVQSVLDAKEIGRALSELASDGKTLFVGVTNLSELYDSGSCEGMDRQLIAKLRCFEIDKLAEDFEQGRIQVQSPAVIISLLRAVRGGGADFVDILRYSNSGGIIGDHQSAVGYLAAAIGNSKSPNVKKAVCTPFDGSSLVELARQSIAEGLGFPRRETKCPENKDMTIDGLYITLEMEGKLRGASSLLFPNQPISEAVSMTAKSAAFNDPRFNPLSVEEARDLEITIYLLSNARRIESPSDFDARKDAIFISRGSYSTLLFPGELNPLLNNEDLLGRACIKAGMLSNCWRQNETSVWTFDVHLLKGNR